MTNKKDIIDIIYQILVMATVIIYNNDVQGALRALKKEQQKEGTFRYTKARKCHKNNHELSQERLTEIIRRKIKDRNEKIANGFYNQICSQNDRPFVFKLYGYDIKIYNTGIVCIFLKNRKINEIMLNEIDFDSEESLLSKLSQEVKKNDNKKLSKDKKEEVEDSIEKN